MIFPRRAIETRRVAERAEALGFSWLGIADSPTVYQESYLHQLEALHVTRRLIVGPVATHVTLRHPLIVGNLLATLNEIGDADRRCPRHREQRCARRRLDARDC